MRTHTYPQAIAKAKTPTRRKQSQVRYTQSGRLDRQNVLHILYIYIFCVFRLLMIRDRQTVRDRLTRNHSGLEIHMGDQSSKTCIVSRTHTQNTVFPATQCFLCTFSLFSSHVIHDIVARVRSRCSDVFQADEFLRIDDLELAVVAVITVVYIVVDEPLARLFAQADVHLIFVRRRGGAAAKQLVLQHRIVDYHVQFGNELETVCTNVLVRRHPQTD